MKHYHEYLMIQYKNGGRGMEYGDCLNLVIEFYKRELGIYLQDHAGYSEKDSRIPYLFIDKYKEFGFEKTNSPKYGDVVLLGSRGIPTHCGVMLDQFYILHTSEYGTKINNVLLLPSRIEVFCYLRYKGTPDDCKIPR